MLASFYRTNQHLFMGNHALYWSNLSRLNNLLVIVNISMLFLTDLVARGYYYTFYSLALLGTVGVGAIVPTRLIQRLWYYWIFLLAELAGIYYLAASILYWVANGSGS